MYTRIPLTLAQARRTPPVTTTPSLVSRVSASGIARAPITRTFGAGAPLTLTQARRTPPVTTTPSLVSRVSASGIARAPITRTFGVGAPPAASIKSGILPSPPASRGGTATTRAGVVPPSTLTDRTPSATAGAFGGESGGLGAAVAAAPASGSTDLGLEGLGDSISSFGKGVVDTINEYMPLAIKVLLAFIVIKIVLWMLRGRR